MSEWISVGERLPEEGKPVLLFQRWPAGIQVKALYYYIDRSHIVMGGLFNNSFRHYNDPDIKVDYVTHWMPLPKAPKDE